MKRILNNVNQNLNKILNVDEKQLECLKKLEENLVYLKKILNALNIKIKNKHHKIKLIFKFL